MTKQARNQKEQTMSTITKSDTIKTITTHYIDGAFVPSHGREVMDISKPIAWRITSRSTAESGA
jgi:hypothetical protein